MAVKIPLKMSDGAVVRTIEDLREHFDLEAVLGYYSSGRLAEWLEEKYYDEEAGKIKALKESSKKFNQKLCEILGVEYSENTGEKLDVKAIKNKNERYELLKKYTADDKILSGAVAVAFTQKDLDALIETIDALDKDAHGNKVIYLCGEHFVIPKDIGKITYKGINSPKVEFAELVDEDGIPEPAEAGINFENLNFSFDDYVTRYKDSDDNGSLPWVMFSYDFTNNPDLAFKIVWASAKKDSAEAWLALGECFDEGIGVEKDIKEAVKWYQKAAEQGNEYAAEQLSILNGIIKSEEMVQKFAEEQIRLAGKGDVHSQVSLGEKYLYGDGVEVDEKEAAKWFIEAVKQGDIGAKVQLNILYNDHQDDEIGIEILDGYKVVIDGLKEKFEQGDRGAIFDLKLLYHEHREDEIGQKAAEVLSAIGESVL